MSCKPVSPELKFGINVFINVVVVFVFLTTFFILFASKLTKSLFEKSIIDLVDANMDGVIHKLDSDTKNTLLQFTKVVPLDKLIKKYETPSDYTVEHNRWVKLSVMAVALMGLVVLGLVMYVVYNTCGRCVYLNEILTENVAVFGVVGLIGYMLFADREFVPVMPGVMVSSLFENLRDNLK